MPCPSNSNFSAIVYGSVLLVVIALSIHESCHPRIDPLSVCHVNAPNGRAHADPSTEARCGWITKDELLPARPSDTVASDRANSADPLKFVCKNLQARQKVRLVDLLGSMKASCQRVEAEFAYPPVAGHDMPAIRYRLVNEPSSSDKSD